jgi:hypothetical protein
LQAMTPLAAGPGGGLPARPPRPTLNIIVGSLTRTVSDSEDSELTEAPASRREATRTCNLAGHRTRLRMCGWRPRRRGSESRGHLDSVISAGKSESPPPVDERCFWNPAGTRFSYGKPLANASGALYRKIAVAAGRIRRCESPYRSQLESERDRPQQARGTSTFGSMGTT